MQRVWPNKLEFYTNCVRWLKDKSCLRSDKTIKSNKIKIKTFTIKFYFENIILFTFQNKKFKEKKKIKKVNGK